LRGGGQGREGKEGKYKGGRGRKVGEGDRKGREGCLNATNLRVGYTKQCSCGWIVS